MYYYKARMYSPKLGRFMQADPIGYGDGMNIYAYGKNDPVNATDPSGLEAGNKKVDNASCPLGRALNGACPDTPPADGEVVVNGQRREPPPEAAKWWEFPRELTGPQNKLSQGTGEGISTPCPHRDALGMCDSYGYPSGTPETLKRERCERAAAVVDPFGSDNGALVGGGLTLFGAIVKVVGRIGWVVSAIQAGAAVERKMWKC